ncbi:MAG: ribonuclease R [Proteobacteria bacterium]|nr:ribonuclease R [Pseudomonadota bacterium]
MAKKAKPRFPTQGEILEYIESADGKVTKRDIADAFHIKGEGRVRLKKILRTLLEEGKIAKDPGQALRPSGALPHVLVVEITGVDQYGDLMARPQKWDKPGPPPRIYLSERRRKAPALGKGETALVRLAPEQDRDGLYYAARIIKVLKGAPRTFIGVYHDTAEGGQIVPADKKTRKVFAVDRETARDISDNSLVLAEASERGGRTFRPLARVLENLGDLSQPKSISLIAIHHHDIPYKFPAEVLAEAERAKPPALKSRVDLRKLPFITIDPADARDHDDAVLAVPDQDPGNPGGWRISIAIADVAHYVRPGSALDQEAEMRGNSCYFPDRVVAMLPEALSADLCSLVRGKDRAVLVCHLKIDRDGAKLSHRFERAIINCAANVSYQQVQAELDKGSGQWSRLTGALYRAYQALDQARKVRGPLELALPERRITLNDDGTIKDISIREVLPTHRMIEDFMVAANVAAAETLTRKNVLCMFRVHEEPGPEKMESLRQFLATLGLKLARGQVTKPETFNRLLRKVEGKGSHDLVNEMVLRTQSQAAYSPDNLGHFGLALSKYAHFTSPIRRYADILVHRGLIKALGLGDDGLKTEEIGAFRKMAEDISTAERRAMAAERESVDRYLAAYLSEQVGATFSARISGVTRFGLFVAVEPTGADGFIPMRTLYDDYYDLDDKAKRLVGRRTGKVYKLGAKLEARLVEAEKITGALRFEVLTEGSLPQNLLRPAGYKKHKRKKGKGRRKP